MSHVLAAPADRRVSAVRRRRRPPRRGYGVVQVVSVASGLALWEVIGRYVVTDQLYFVPFSAVIGALADLARSGDLFTHIAASGQEFALGFAIAAVVGIVAGLALGASPVLRAIADPWISGLYATPLVALMPLYLIIFGIGPAGKAALVVTVAIFPVMINTSVGVATTDPALVEVARAYQAGRWTTFRKVYLPASLPHIVAGLRLGLGRGLTGVVVGEFFFSNRGLGYLIARSGQSFDTATLFAAILLLTCSAVILDQSLRFAERRLASWRHA